MATRAIDGLHHQESPHSGRLFPGGRLYVTTRSSDLQSGGVILRVYILVVYSLGPKTSDLYLLALKVCILSLYTWGVYSGGIHSLQLPTSDLDLYLLGRGLYLLRVYIHS